jgi:hypothetical protein
MAFDIGNILQQFLGADDHTKAERALNDFDQVASVAPRSTMAQGVAEALRSDQTPPFASMVSQLFDRSDSTQRAGMLNQLLRSIGPGVLASVAGGILGKLGASQDAPAALTPEQAAAVTPQQVEQIAAAAEQEDPDIADRIGDFYAAHPTLVKTIGGAALAIVLGRVAQGMRH